MSVEEIWDLYLHHKQTVAEIADQTHLSASTIKRRLSEVDIVWHQPQIEGCGVVHLDATYFGRNTGVLIALESGSGQLLYMQHITHEHVSDYEAAVSHIQSQGYLIKGIVVDGIQKLFTALNAFPLQMCQFHLVAIVRRKLTKNPQLPAGRELLNMVYRLKGMDRKSFTAEFEGWKKRWRKFLAEKTTNPVTGKTIYTHQRLRSAMVSISFYIKWLFTFEKVEGVPNTNNIIEGTFTDLKNNLRNHPGMSQENRKRFMNGFFLAYTELHKTEKGGT